jgi:hypothetical protein
LVVVVVCRLAQPTWDRNNRAAVVQLDGRCERWRIHYGDGSILEGTDKVSFYQAPPDNVQIVTVFHVGRYKYFDANKVIQTRNYRSCVGGWDYYWLNKDGTVGRGNNPQAIPNDLPPGATKEGAWMGDKYDFYALEKSAYDNWKVPV